MAEAVSWLVELEVNSDCLDAFRTLTSEMVEATISEPGTLIYERFISLDGAVVHLYERYRDAAAALAHLRAFQDVFADRFLALVDRKQVFVYGDVSIELRAVLDRLRPAYFHYLNGFAR